MTDQSINTPETIYKKSHVLYGIDQAKREIAKQGGCDRRGVHRRDGCHLAGYRPLSRPAAPPSAPTITVLRRLC